MSVRKRNFGAPTPQDKMISINNKFGNTGIKHQQGTTRIIYDALPIPALPTGAFTLIFFENVKTRKFPFTNLPENKLQVGETIALQDYYMSLIAVDGGTGAVIWEKPFEAYPQTEGLYRADMDFMIGENRVLKSVKIGSSQSSFNYGANFISQQQTVATTTVTGADYTLTEKGHVVYPLRTDLVIPPDIEFVAPVKFSGMLALPTLPLGVTLYVMLTLEGSASILAPRTTF